MMICIKEIKFLGLLFLIFEGCQSKNHTISQVDATTLLTISLADSIFYSEMNVNEDSVKIDKIQVRMNFQLTDTIFIEDRKYYVNDNKNNENYKYAFIKADIKYDDINKPEITLKYFPRLAEGLICVFHFSLKNKKYTLEKKYFGYVERDYPKDIKLLP